MLFTDIKLVGFFSNIPLELAFGKKSGASPRRLYHQVTIPVLAELTAAQWHVVAQY
ncbi:hypothetical protein [Aeromonas veronii]|uniref:hypothetical protein n=1 Tax=Aeromonas veronii TaxID=654 RepID=UPI000AF413C4|nr:hypothetical protein [Aeromonas veronii]UPK54435.1 hypothetical protein MYF86_18430 [Aeromonas veronii]